MTTPIYSSVKSPQEVAKVLAQTINKHLAANKKVLWFVAGGSCIAVAALAAKQVNPKYASNLAITLTDERYGPPGHADSNWRQLEEAGFSAPAAHLLPVLHGQSLSETVKSDQEMLVKELKATHYSLALAGMGPDGHIFGIKPNSSSVSADDEVVGYEWDDYVRITPTIKLIKRLDEVIVYAVGREKWPQFDKLVENLDPEEQPAQLLKQLKKVIIFTDYKGERA